MAGNVENNQAMNQLKGNVFVIPSVDSTLSKEGYAADAKATGDGLAARVKTADIVDNLVSTEADKPLSAKQGALLKKQIDELSAKLEG